MRHIKPYSQLFENTQELTPEQKDWLDKCTKGTWDINSQTGLVDVDGYFYCQEQYLSDFKGVRFGEVSGIFNCAINSLTSLEGAPHVVGGSFDCSENELTSLEEAPQSVGGAFFCSENELTSLKGAPREVGRDFNCSDNSLTSLDGAPREVGGSINCFNNPITEWVIEGLLREMSNEGITLEQAVERLWNEIPEEDRTYLAKHNPNLSPEQKRGYEALERLKTKVI